VTIKAKTNELEANAKIEGEGLPCTLSLDAVEVVEGDRTSAIALKITLDTIWLHGIQTVSKKQIN